MKIGIGIDTGGTYTDAVVYDFHNKKILDSAKALTTKNDLSVGILGALDQIAPQYLHQAEMVALSTTLATNACVEDKGGEARLIFFGGDRRVLDPNGAKYGLPSSEKILIEPCETRITGEIDAAPDWEKFTSQIKKQLGNTGAAAIVEVHAMRNGAIIEKKAEEILSLVSPETFVTTGYKLSSELNSLQRASSALLNARLFPIIKDFLRSISTALTARGMQPAVVIVRSDGSLMSEAFAALHPVETLLCGPAASVIGGSMLCDAPNAIIVDIGGTTTDIAIVKDRIPVKAVDGVMIGRWRTYVNGLYVKTIGLGGDSAIHYDEDKIFLEPYRVVPLCIAARKYPVILEHLRMLADEGITNQRYPYEHYLPVKDISGNTSYNEKERAFCEALKNGPISRKEAMANFDADIYNVNRSRLIKEGIVELCGLTPTDIMHVKGDFSIHSVEAARLAVECVARRFEISCETLCEQVYEKIRHKLYINIAEAMLENTRPHFMRNGIHEEVRRCIEMSYEAAKCTSRRNDVMTLGIGTDFSLVGIGAPTHIFLPDVARLLGTRAHISPYSGVANALGAIVGNVAASYTVEVRANSNLESAEGAYTVFGPDGNRAFNELNKAEDFARIEAEKGARKEALQRGATGEITVTITLREMIGHAKECTICLGTSVTAQAIGAIGFSTSAN